MLIESSDFSMVAKVAPGLAVWIVFAAVIAVTGVLYRTVSGALRRDEAIRRALKELPSDGELERERNEEAELLFDEGTRSQVLRKLQEEKAEAEHGPPKPPPDRWD